MEIPTFGRGFCHDADSQFLHIFEVRLARRASCGVQVREELREYAAGVTGVPHFIINGKYHLSGAQDPDTLAQVLAKA